MIKSIIKYLFFHYFNLTLNSYDGSSCSSGIGLTTGEAPTRSRNPVPYRNTKHTAVDAVIHWRTSSVGAASPSDYKERESGIQKKSSSVQQQKMSDLNVARGHSPHFSPSRNNGNLLNLIIFFFFISFKSR